MMTFSQAMMIAPEIDLEEIENLKSAKIYCKALIEQIKQNKIRDNTA